MSHAAVCGEQLGQIQRIVKARTGWFSPTEQLAVDGAAPTHRQYRAAVSLDPSPGIFPEVAVGRRELRLDPEHPSSPTPASPSDLRHGTVAAPSAIRTALRRTPRCRTAYRPSSLAPAQ